MNPLVVAFPDISQIDALGRINSARGLSPDAIRL